MTRRPTGTQSAGAHRAPDAMKMITQQNGKNGGGIYLERHGTHYSRGDRKLGVPGRGLIVSPWLDPHHGQPPLASLPGGVIGECGRGAFYKSADK